MEMDEISIHNGPLILKPRPLRPPTLAGVERSPNTLHHPSKVRGQEPPRLLNKKRRPGLREGPVTIGAREKSCGSVVALEYSHLELLVNFLGVTLT